MAKGNKPSEGMGETTSNVAGEPRQHFTPPAGYEKQSGDVVGFWDDSKQPIHFTPMHAVITDSQLDHNKPSILIVGRLEDASLLYMGEEDVQGEAGDLVGVWAKPGMKPLRDAMGVKAWIVLTGEKATGKPNPMKTYDVFTSGRGRPLRIEADYRVHSKNIRHMLEGSPLSHANPTPNGAGSDDAGF